MIHVEFTYGNGQDYTVIDVSNWNRIDLAWLDNFQHKHYGRSLSGVSVGYPAHCPYCGVRTVLLPFPDSSLICDWCLKWDERLQA
jgi:hypothetical protein